MRHVSNGKQKVSYELRFGRGRDLTISVHPNLHVTARAPVGAAPNRVDARVLARSVWIRRQQRRFLEFHPLPHPKRFIGGETHYYLGRGRRLRVISGPVGVRRQGPLLVVSVPGRRSGRAVRDALESWYRERAGEVLRERLERILRSAGVRLLHPVRVRIQKMSVRWGSCSAGGTVTLNLDLVKAPVSCIDYVIVHELCHLRELRHSRQFYATLERLVPDWERARGRLSTFGR